MENAAQAALRAIEDWLDEFEEPEVVIFCGLGNNGGDGLALARLLLADREIGLTVLLAGSPDELSGDARVQYDILFKLLHPLEIHSFENRKEIYEKIKRYPDIVVDALLGTGSHGELHGAIKDAVEYINGLGADGGAHVIAIDIPTGLDADKGIFNIVSRFSDAAVRAGRTVTMAAPKIGFYQGDAKAFTGEITVAKLGASMTVEFSDNKEAAHLVEEDDISPPHINDTASKITRGRILAVCGSRGMTGAAIMSGMAALKSGCGMVTVAVPASERPIVAQAMPELLTVGLSEQEDGSPSLDAWEELQEYIERVDTVLIGCGLRPLPGTSELIRKIITEVDKPMVIDAGGLGALVGYLDILKSRKAATILTPHVGEIARLVDRPWQEVERGRLAVARSLAGKYDVVVVMKGAPTYTVWSETTFINSTGNAGLATAGTGDVLSGILATMLVQNPNTSSWTAMEAVYLHGLAGDLAAKEKTMHGMTAMDVIAMLPAAFKHLER